MTITMASFSRSSLYAALPESGDQTLQRASTLEFVEFDANQIEVWVGNNGHTVSHIPTGRPGLEWPKVDGYGNKAIFASGIWCAGMVDGELRTAIAEFSTEFRPGYVDYDPSGSISGNPSNPEDVDQQVYWITQGDCSDPAMDCYNWEYANWPAGLGAPSQDGEYFSDEDGDGLYDPGETFRDFNLNAVYDGPDGAFITGEDPPFFKTPQQAWWVLNDFDPEKHEHVFSTQPLGLEVQTTLHAPLDGYVLENVLFYEFLIINKGGETIEDVFIGHWTDADLGDANDDLVGCDTTLDMGFTYNGTPNDQDYGTRPPAVGYAFLQSALIPSPGDSTMVNGGWIEGYRDLGMTSHYTIFKSTPNWHDPQTAEAAYLVLQGLGEDGEGRPDPNGDPSVFHHSGDPYRGSGWLLRDEASPREWRNVISSGPLTLDPWNDPDGDERPEAGEPGVQHIVLAMALGQGLDAEHSIEVLRHTMGHARSAWRQQLTLPEIATPEVNASTLDGEIILSWYRGAAELESFSDKGYRFEGYRVYQGESANGPWHEIALYDQENGVRVILQEEWKPLSGALIPQVLYQGDDSGLQHILHVRRDSLANSGLVNNREYHFAVTAYAHGPLEQPRSIESELIPLSLRPHGPPLGVEMSFQARDTIAVFNAGDAQAEVWVKVLDPLQLTGDLYAIEFETFPEVDSIRWYLGRMRNSIMVDTLYTGGKRLIDIDYPWYNRPNDPYWAYRDSTEFIEGFRVVLSLAAIEAQRFIYGWEQTMNVEEGSIDSITYLAISPGGVDSLVWSAGVGSDTINIDSLYGPGNYWDRPQWIEDGETYIRLYREELHDVHIQSFASDVGGENHMAASIPGIGGGMTDLAQITGDIELRFSEEGQKAWRWSPSNGLVPEMSRFPFEVWDLERNVQLTMGHVDWNDTGVMHDDSAGSLERDWIITLHRDYATYQDSVQELFSNPHSGWLWIFSTSSVYSMGDRVKLEILNPIIPGEDIYSFRSSVPGEVSDSQRLAQQLDRINVFPNPYFGQNTEELPGENFVTFTGLPPGECTLRIFSLGGTMVRKFDHAESSTAGTPYEHWNLLNEAGEKVASGMYIVHIDVPEVGKKILKLAVMQSAYE